jgi:hypothetical protein
MGQPSGQNNEGDPTGGDAGAGKTLTLNFGPDGQITIDGQAMDLGSAIKMIVDMSEGSEPGEGEAAFADGYAGKPVAQAPGM